MTRIAAKIAGAPISWGVCEVPDWGLQLDSERVLAEMSELGLNATEFGPAGFLPEDPEGKAATLARYGLVAVGGFVPVVLHDTEHDPLPEIEEELMGYEAAGASVLILAAATGIEGYDMPGLELDEEGWATLLANIDRISAAAFDKRVQAVIHPHVGTMVETNADIDKVLSGSTIPFCLDTGHLLIGGTDPVRFAAEHADRISHSHLKDVNLLWAEKVRNGELGYYDAVVQGLYRPLGQGDIDVRAIVSSLVTGGYTGWFTIEQDNIVSEEPAIGEGPVVAAGTSVNFLRSVLAELELAAQEGE